MAFPLCSTAQSSEPIEPQYTTDEKSDLAFVRVSCYIPNLTVSRKFTAKKLRPKIVKQADNATIKTDFQEDCFTVTVSGNTAGTMNGKIYELKIRKLPKLITPGESSYQVKEDRVVILLRKKIVESWYPELEEGLDAYEEPPEDEEKEEKAVEVKDSEKNKLEENSKDNTDVMNEKTENADNG